MQLPLQYLRVPPPVPAGMNYLLLGSIAYQLRTSHHDVHPPIVVERLGPEDYRIVEGRHRWVASLIAGRTHVAAVEAESPEERQYTNLLQ